MHVCMHVCIYLRIYVCVQLEYIVTDWLIESLYDINVTDSFKYHDNYVTITELPIG